METFIVLCTGNEKQSVSSSRNERSKGERENLWTMKSDVEKWMKWCWKNIFLFLLSFLHEFYSHYQENYIFTRSYSTHIHSISICTFLAMILPFLCRFSPLKWSIFLLTHASFARRWLLLAGYSLSLSIHTKAFFLL